MALGISFAFQKDWLDRKQINTKFPANASKFLRMYAFFISELLFSEKTSEKM